MKRIASVSVVAGVLAASGAIGCAAQVDTSGTSGGTSESTHESSSPVSAASAIQELARTQASAPRPEASTLAVALNTNWVAIPNTWSQMYGTGTGGVAGYSFPFPTPWITWTTTSQPNMVVDFYAFFYEHDELMPIVTANNTPAYDGYQWYVAQASLVSCTETGVIDPRTGGPISGICIGTVQSSLRFLVPFTDTAEEGELDTAEASWLGQESDVEAAITIRPAVYRLLTNSRGGLISGTTAGGAATYMLSPSPAAVYPYADVHDPKVPPV